MLNSLGENIWELSEPLKLAGLFELGHRMTVIRLSSGQLILHSPVRYHDGLAAELARLGTVGTIVAPSAFHYHYLPEWLQAYPAARLLAPEGFSEKCLKIDGLLPGSWPGEYAPELQVTKIEGMPSINEIAFCHASSKSLIVADFVFNLGRDCSFPTRAMLKMSGVYRIKGPSRLYRAFIKDRGAMRRSVDEIVEWTFDRIVVGHGDIIDADGPEIVSTAYEWL